MDDKTLNIRRQRRRRGWQLGFFIVFVVTPLFDGFRYDLTLGHAFFLGMPWRLGIDEFIAGRISSGDIALNLLLRLVLPLAVVGGGLILVAWRWGRIYCGWLCPHFSVVETIHGAMRNASGKPSIWDKAPPWFQDQGIRQASGAYLIPDRRWWLITLPLALGFGWLWAVVLLSYLLPPWQVYQHLFQASLSRGEQIFIGAATTVFTLEFLLARHLFCRFACAVGLFQSLAWMSNRNAMVVGFERPRAAACTRCRDLGGVAYSACDQVCPMRLKPRTVKQNMFTCTQCGQCIAACQTVQGNQPSLLRWVADEAARKNEATVSLTGRRDQAER